MSGLLCICWFDIGMGDLMARTLFPSIIEQCMQACVLREIGQMEIVERQYEVALTASLTAYTAHSLKETASNCTYHFQRIAERSQSIGIKRAVKRLQKY